MLLKTGNSQVRFKPRAIEGVDLAPGTDAKFLLLDGQQRLTSLTQALSGDGVVHTKDARGKLFDRRYLVHMLTALSDQNRVDEAVISIPADGVIHSNFGKNVVLDLNDHDKQRQHGYFPLHLLYGDYMSWILELDDRVASEDPVIDMAGMRALAAGRVGPRRRFRSFAVVPTRLPRTLMAVSSELPRVPL